MVNGIEVIKHNLPDNIEDLTKFALIGREKLVAVRAEIRAINKVGLAKEVHEQKLKEAQEIADAVLDAEVKIGELLASVPSASNMNAKKREITDEPSFSEKQQARSDIGISLQQAKRFQTLAKHPDAVEQAKKEALENGEIATRSSVMKIINEKKKDDRLEQLHKSADEKIKEASHDIDIFNTTTKYRVIYADPPWKYSDKQNNANMGGAEKHYPTMELSEIASLPVSEIIDKNAVLFIWVTSPMLEDAFSVINRWGFKYKTSFIWDKIAHNMGHYNSVRHEFLLVCTKGSCTPDVKKLFDSVQSIERKKHSEKPEEFRDIIDTLYIEGNKLEMFARHSSDKWDAWGNMV